MVVAQNNICQLDTFRGKNIGPNSGGRCPKRADFINEENTLHSDRTSRIHISPVT